MELSAIKGIGPTRLESLRAVGVCSLRDLLYFLPQRYEDRTHPIPCADANGGEVLVMGVVQDTPKLSRFNGLTRVTAYLWDDSGKLPLVWYNQPWMMQNLPVGQTIMLFGRMGQSREKPVLQNAQRVTEPCILPVYRAVKGIPAKSFREMMQQALEQVDDCCPETLPNDLRIRHQLCELNFAIRQAHFPLNVENLRLARRRLAFEQMLMYQAALGLLRGHKEDGTALPIPPDAPEKFWQTLPFPPTGAQKRVLEEIAADLRCDRAMSRLVQGDVGCGKTIVAILMMAALAENGYQAVLMAPTQVLAKQHYADLCAILEPVGFHIAYLSSNMKAKEKKAVLASIATGAANIIVGTHSVIGKSVEYKNLGITVTDEEHKFGVAQRAALVEKAAAGVHSITMSATPIPRTLAQVIYGSAIDLYTIQTMPAGRKPVVTGIATDEERIMRFVLSQKRKGHQCYVVSPMIDSSEDMAGVLSVEEVSREYEKWLKPYGVRIATLTGRDSKETTEETIQKFKDGTIDVLIATTVIEVGVNVPNATAMIITNAERFGLSSLHQLRGRVGRSSLQSYCVLQSTDLSEKAMQRLGAMVRTTNGFEIAEEDLKIRGAGDFLGTRQSGENKYMALMLAYPDKYKYAQSLANRILDDRKKCLILTKVLAEQEDESGE